jgi:hypothetical protein
VDDVVVPLTVEPPGRVADGSEPTVETGPEPVVVAPEGLPDEPDSVPEVDEVIVVPDDVVADDDESVDVDPDEVVDPEDEFDDSEELDDESESFGAANAAPIPPVPTNPTTPSEKARAPTLKACFCEFTYSPSAALDP